MPAYACFCLIMLVGQGVGQARADSLPTGSLNVAALKMRSHDTSLDRRALLREKLAALAANETERPPDLVVVPEHTFYKGYTDHPVHIEPDGYGYFRVVSSVNDGELETWAGSVWVRVHPPPPEPDAEPPLVANGINTALECYIVGIDPTDPESRFAIENVAAEADGFAIRFDTVQGRRYTVEFADRLADPVNWEILTNQIPGSGHSVAVHDMFAPEIGTRFYRVKAGLE